MLTSKDALIMFPALGLLAGFSQGTALKTELRAGGEQGQGIYFPSSFPAGLWVHLGRVPASVQGLLLYLQLSLPLTPLFLGA